MQVPAAHLRVRARGAPLRALPAHAAPPLLDARCSPKNFLKMYNVTMIFNLFSDPCIVILQSQCITPAGCSRRPPAPTPTLRPGSAFYKATYYKNV